MIPFLHWPLVQALLDCVAATTATPDALSHEAAEASSTLQLLSRPLPGQPGRPTLLFFDGRASNADRDASVKRMYELLAAQLSVDIGCSFSEPERQVAARPLQLALDLLEARLGAKGNAGVLGALVRSFLVVKQPLFASHPSLLGMVVLGPQPYLDEVDLSTLVLHEVVHQAIFLHDMVEPLFEPAARVQLPTAYNPLLDAERPLDMCYHAAFISYVVARLYAESGRSGEAAALLNPLGRCLRGLAAASSSLTRRGNAHLRWLEQRFAVEDWLQRMLAEPTPPTGGSSRARSYSALHR